MDDKCLKWLREMMICPRVMDDEHLRRMRDVWQYVRWSLVVDRIDRTGKIGVSMNEHEFFGETFRERLPRAQYQADKRAKEAWSRLEEWQQAGACSGTRQLTGAEARWRRKRAARKRAEAAAEADAEANAEVERRLREWPECRCSPEARWLAAELGCLPCDCPCYIDEERGWAVRSGPPGCDGRPAQDCDSRQQRRWQRRATRRRREGGRGGAEKKRRRELKGPFLQLLRRGARRRELRGGGRGGAPRKRGSEEEAEEESREEEAEEERRRGLPATAREAPAVATEGADLAATASTTPTSAASEEEDGPGLVDGGLPAPCWADCEGPAQKSQRLLRGLVGIGWPEAVCLRYVGRTAGSHAQSPGGSIAGRSIGGRLVDGRPARDQEVVRGKAGRFVTGCLACVRGGWWWWCVLGLLCVFVCVVLRVWWLRYGRPARKRPALSRGKARCMTGCTASGTVRLCCGRTLPDGWGLPVRGGPPACHAISAGRAEIADFGRLRNLCARPREPD